MLNSVPTASTTVTNTQEIKLKKYNNNPSFRGEAAVKLERTPETDTLEKQGMSTGGKIGLGTLGAACVATAADFIITGGKNVKRLFGFVDDAVKGQSSTPNSSKPSDIVEEAVESVKTKAKKKPGRRKMNKQQIIDRAVQQELEDKSASQVHVRYRQRLTRAQKAAIRANNEVAQRAHAEATQIANNAIGVENLQAIVEPKSVVAPKVKQAVDAVAQKIGALEGQVKVIEQRIAGAKKFGKDTSKLEKELANLQAKVAELKK